MQCGPVVTVATEPDSERDATVPIHVSIIAAVE